MQPLRKTSDEQARLEIRILMNNGIYHQDELFRRIYPTYIGHYSKLRELIAEEKHYA